MKQEIKGFANKLFGVGHVSMMRVLTFFVVVDIMVVWTISCIKSGFTIQDFPVGVVGIFLSVVTGKAVQRFAENGGEKKEKEEDKQC